MEIAIEIVKWTAIVLVGFFFALTVGTTVALLTGLWMLKVVVPIMERMFPED